MGAWGTELQTWAQKELEDAGISPRSDNPALPAPVTLPPLVLVPDLVDRLWPHANHSLVDGICTHSAAAFAKYSFRDYNEIADFMAQVSEETGGGTVLEENLNYSAPRLCQVWPAMFPTLAAATPFAMNPRLLAAKVYGSRLGNRPGTDDGWVFRGRGLIQLTGRANYERIGKYAGLDLTEAPETVCAPATTLQCACAYWALAGANKYADALDFAGETRLINGAETNLDLRQEWRITWRRALGLKD